MIQTMMGYVNGTDSILQKNIYNTSEQVRELSEIFLNGGFESVIIVASGSSYNAALMGQQAMMNLLKLPVMVLTSEQLMFDRELFLPNPFYFVVSQSGASTNTISAVEFLLEKNKSVAVLTGNLTSEIAIRNPYLTYDYGVGIERIHYVTLGLSTLFEFLYLFAVNTSVHFSVEEKNSYVDHLKNTILQLSLVIERSKKYIHNHLLEFGSMDKTFICGNDVHFGVAREAALKLQETIHIPVLHYEIEEFLHGPDIQLSPEYSVFLIDNYSSNKRINAIYRSLEGTVKNRFLITNQYSEDKNVLILPKASILELSPLNTVVAFQVLSATLQEKLEIKEVHPFTRKFREEIPIKIKQ